ncbi:MAG: 2-succinyl-6-hydroxy-2,4-cyclohexadiene-1-carboxylate synthase [Deltaproteobacteria bacterium]|jgi:2-succinyl-6-hydroxy-2,4-cyclohexadiene-1-carboxylate synthase|nr:2-succinyl-6-hydroxy-2,4-cyclohexadiene-1-carboxylate synthase [Deltaproteobacteria bacterium]MBW2496440.1 2-succinyl-6-hydroxy-2,4-cyclohexadiene-1-carboxylate synthase [Deltaproteobacteria bacterium]
MSAPEVRFVEAAGVRLRVLLDAAAAAGSGSTQRSLLVLHGFTGDAESMACVTKGLGARARVARLELIGHGESEAPTAVVPYAMSACAEQIVAAADGLGLERPHLLGYSMGGRAALAAAVSAPDRFASLVLVGASAGIEEPEAREERIAADRDLAHRIESGGVERFVEAWMAQPLFASQARLGEGALSRARAQRLRNRPHGLANSLRGMGTGAQAPLHDRLPGLDLPVLLVVGEEDAKFRAIAASLGRLLPDARVCVLPEAGHAAHLEAPERFAEVVSDFLARVDARDRSAGRATHEGPRGDPGRGPGEGGRR